MLHSFQISIPNSLLKLLNIISFIHFIITPMTAICIWGYVQCIHTMLTFVKKSNFNWAIRYQYVY